MPKLAIITTHPVQYYAPLYAMLSSNPELECKVFFTWSQKQVDAYDRDFKINITWDIPLLNDYSYTFVKNQASDPGNHHFRGIQCPSLVHEIEKWGATHLLIFGWNYHAHLHTMRYFKGRIPVWFRGDSTLLDYEIKRPGDIRLKYFVSDVKQFAKFKTRKAFLTWVYRYADKAFYVGANNKDYYLTHGMKEPQLVFSPHAIDNDRFYDNFQNQYEARALYWRRNLGLEDDDYVILFCGKFELKKNPVLLIKCINRLKETKPHLQIKLLMVGNGILENELKKMASHNPSIQFLPFQNQTKMPLIYRLANVYCLPSQGPGETWGLAVNEAMACGRPVLVSNKVGCARDLVNSHTGLIFESGNETDFMNKMEWLAYRKTTFSADVIQQNIKSWSFEAISNAIISQLNAHE